MFNDLRCIYIGVFVDHHSQFENRNIVYSNPQLNQPDRKVSGVRLSVRPSVRPYVVSFSHFQLLLQNHCMTNHQSYHNFSSISAFLSDWKFKMVVMASDWPSFFSISSSERLHVKSVNKLARNIPLVVLTKCSCFSERFGLRLAVNIFDFDLPNLLHLTI